MPPVAEPNTIQIQRLDKPKDNKYKKKASGKLCVNHQILMPGYLWRR